MSPSSSSSSSSSSTSSSSSSSSNTIFYWYWQLLNDSADNNLWWWGGWWWWRSFLHLYLMLSHCCNISISQTVTITISAVVFISSYVLPLHSCIIHLVVPIRLEISVWYGKEKQFSHSRLLIICYQTMNILNNVSMFILLLF